MTLYAPTGEELRCKPTTDAPEGSQLIGYIQLPHFCRDGAPGIMALWAIIGELRRNATRPYKEKLYVINRNAA